jgi:hypothetical protein
MGKKEDFKEFVKSKPELVQYIKNKDMTMQGFYEIYDIYGEDEKAWEPYLKRNDASAPKFSEILKNINLDDVEHHINTAQKALGAVGEFASKNENNISNIIKGPLTSRPLNKFFED